MKPQRHHRAFAIAAAVAILAAACGDDDDAAGTTTAETVAAPRDTAAATTPATLDTTAAPETTAAPDTTEMTVAPETTATALEGDLVGVFEIAAGTCDGATVSGSYFRMIQTGGTADGPFIPNGDSACVGDQTYSLLAPGTDGGLATGRHQPAPDPAFDAAGNAIADAIAQPVTFFGVAFGVATDEATDPPALTAAAGALSGQVQGWTAYYGGAPFNQGSPKPDGTKPGLTNDVTGTIDPATGEFVIEWSSQIIGGAFDSFTGIWHLEGVFQPD
ncbi:MAG: hypothetical protein ACXWEI_19705 [Mycobacterium sp.]